MKGYYSVIQYCPDRSRAEAANVGVVLFTENPHHLAVKLSETYARVERFFKPNRQRLARIIDAARASATRLNHSMEDMATVEELDHFTRTMGNDIRMTPPRIVVVSDVQQDVLKLYDELVGDSQPARSRRAVVLPSSINRVFEELSQHQKVWSPGKIRVPVIGRTIDIPYAYRNGVVNYVKPAIFTPDAHVDDKAARLALEGDQIRKNPEDDLTGGKQRRLIVVSAAASDPQVEQRVGPLFAEYGVKYVPKSQADEFAEQVRREAK